MFVLYAPYLLVISVEQSLENGPLRLRLRLLGAAPLRLGSTTGRDHGALPDRGHILHPGRQQILGFRAVSVDFRTCFATRFHHFGPSLSSFPTRNWLETASKCLEPRRSAPRELGGSGEHPVHPGAEPHLGIPIEPLGHLFWMNNMAFSYISLENRC